MEPTPQLRESDTPVMGSPASEIPWFGTVTRESDTPVRERPTTVAGRVGRDGVAVCERATPEVAGWREPATRVVD